MVTKLGPPIFSKKNVYGRILKFLYNRRGDRLNLKKICDKFPNENEFYIRQCLGWLIEDQLIISETLELQKNTDDGYRFEDEDVFRISHDGYKFILELASNHYSFWFSFLAVVISIIAVVISANA